MGLVLLILRIGIYESGMYDFIKKEADIRKGSFHQLFTARMRFFKYVKCILIGAPLWFVVGILITFSPEFAKTLGVKDNISAGTAVMYCYIGLAAGDFLSGLASQVLISRYCLRSAWYWLRVLGCICYQCIRAVRHKPARHCHNYGT